MSEAERVYGWKDIAKALGEVFGDEFDPENVRKLAVRRTDPLPVFKDRARGDVYAHRSALRDWRHRQLVPYSLAKSIAEDD